MLDLSEREPRGTSPEEPEAVERAVLEFLSRLTVR